jgi:plasmid stability protein
MASMTIRNLDDNLKARLRVQAARHNRSMEDEARDILRVALAASASPPQNLGRAIRDRLQACGGIDLDLPVRQAVRAAPDFS